MTDEDEAKARAKSLIGNLEILLFIWSVMNAFILRAMKFKRRIEQKKNRERFDKKRSEFRVGEKVSHSF